MTKFKVVYEFEAATIEEAVQKVFASVYLSDIDAAGISVEAVNGSETFQFPLTQSVVRQLSEERKVRRPADVVAPPAEGEWGIVTDAENRVGDD